MNYEDKYNEKKRWEITVDKSGHYHLTQFIDGEMTGKIRTTKKWIKEVGIYDMKPIIPEKEKKHNERGAGRKPTLTEEETEKIKYERKVYGSTITNLAEKFNVSRGTIHSIVKNL